MSDLSRRQLLQSGICGVAGLGALVLPAHAQPTPATEDVHDFQAFLDRNGIPQVQPAAKWEATHEDILGPFFVKGAPFRGKVTPPLEPGQLLVMRGRVWSFGSKRPIANAVLDVWQADAKGNYDMDDPKNPPKPSAFRNRIRLVTDETGFYEFETIRPASYRIGAGPTDFRPAHIHYMAQARGHAKLITQMYFKGDRFNRTDRWASQSNLIVEPKTIKTPHGKYEQGTFDLVLARA